MRYNKVVYFFIFSFSVFFIGGCTEKIDLDLDVIEPTPVINGVVSNEEQWVRLSTTSAYLKGEGRVISSADVTISDGVNSYTLQESTEEKGLYELQSAITINSASEYKLNVKADFDGNGVKKEYWAKSKVAFTPELDSITIQPITTFRDTAWFVQINYQEVTESNSYLCRTSVNDSLFVGFGSYDLFDNRFMKGGYMERKMIAVLFDRPQSDDKVQVGDTIKVNFSGITKEYFNFMYGAMNEAEGQNPLFGGPPANVKGNISDGALGMFAVYISSTKSVILKDEKVK